MGPVGSCPPLPPSDLLAEFARQIRSDATPTMIFATFLGRIPDSLAISKPPCIFRQGLTQSARHTIVIRMETTDEHLALAAAGGDRDAFAALMARSYDRLFALAFRLTGSRAEAEDLTQDICAALPAKLRNYRAESRFSTWAYRVVVNAAHDRRRRAASHARAADGWGDWEKNRRASDAETQGRIDWLTGAMTALPADLRDTIALLLDDELTHAEAGKVLGISEGTISWRVSQAKKILRQQALEEQQP